MPFKCQVCGKGTTSGNRLDRRGRAKAQGGVGLKLTGKSRRKFRPNLQKMRVNVNGAAKRMLVCASCLRSGKVVKAG